MLRRDWRRARAPWHHDQPFEYIDDENDLGKIIDELTSYKEIAIDLEHHSHRTFAGITCLMQISTRDKDYVLDTISLRNKMFLLNNVFVDPSIVKVFHGCRHDIEWLQRDFGLYIVNCFDTLDLKEYILKILCQMEMQVVLSPAIALVCPLGATG